MKKLFDFFCMSMVLIYVGCAPKPTQISESSDQVFSNRVVLIDTRNSLQYASFHIEGSENLWWQDFLILQNPKTKKRIFDPDLKQTVERLAHKGIHPDRFIWLIGDTADSIENKKWKWLLSYLEISEVKSVSISELSKMKNPRWKKSEKMNPWNLKTSEDFQNDLIKRKIPLCFTKEMKKWDDRHCY